MPSKTTAYRWKFIFVELAGIVDVVVITVEVETVVEVEVVVGTVVVVVVPDPPITVAMLEYVRPALSVTTTQ